MANLGELFYSLGVKEDKNLDKRLEDIKKKLSGLEFKITVDPSALATLTKLSTSAQALGDINKKLGMSSAQLASQQRQDAITAARTAAIQNTANNQTLLSQQRIATEAARTAVVNERLRQSVERAANAQKNLADKSAFTNKTFTNQRVIAYQLANALGQAFSVYAVGAFIKKLAEVRGEFELQKVALQAIIRDTEKADKIFTQIKTLAVESPFQFKDLISYTKQLAAFSIPAENLFDTMKRLADVSAGLGVDMGRITLAYGQVRAATVLRGQELRQFTEAGIPLVDKLAEKFSKLEGKTVSAGEVFERISNRMVSFKMVDQIFTDITSSGGMFFDMQKKQAETLAGKLSNLTDAYQIMLNAMGERSQGTLKGGVDMLTNLMRNWESIATTLKVVIAAYGSYKAISFIVATSEKINAAVRAEAIILMRAQAGATVALSRAEIIATAQSNALTKSMAGLNAVAKANLWVAAISALVAIGSYAYIAYQKSHQLENELSKIFKDTRGEAEATVAQISALEIKLKGAAEGTQKRKEIIESLNSIMSPYLSSILKESDSYETIKKNIDLATEAIYNNSRAKIYTAGINVINTSQEKQISDAESRVRKGLIDSFGITETMATEIIQKMFTSIRENPEITKQAGGVFTFMQKTLGEFKIQVNPYNIPQGVIPGIEKYAEAISETAIETAKLEQKTKALDKSDSILSKSLKEISNRYDEQRKKAKDLGSGDAYANEMKRIKIAQLAEEGDLLRKNGLLEQANAKDRAIQEEAPTGTLTKRIQLSIDKLKEFGEANREAAKNIRENIPDEEIYKDFAESLIDAKKKLDAAISTPAETLTPERTIESKAKFVAALKEKYNLYKKINEDILGQFNTKAEKKEDNALVEKVKDQIDVIKEARKAYEDYQKVLSKSSAKAKTEQQYPGIPISDVDVVAKLQELYNQLGAVSGKSSDDQKAKILSDINDIEKDGILKGFDKLLADVQAYFDANKEKFDLYKMVEDITGNRQLAMEVSFGVEFKDKDIRDVLKQQILDIVEPIGIDIKGKLEGSLREVSFKDLLNETDLSKMSPALIAQFKVAFDALKSYEDSEYKESLTRTAALLKEYGSSETKKAAIRIEFGKKLADAEKNELGLSEQNKLALIENIKVAQTSALNEIDATAFRLSDTYRELFSDMEKYSIGRIKSIIKAGESIIAQTKKQKAVDGKFTVISPTTGKQETLPETEVKNIIKQVQKLKDDLAANDPFLKISEGFKLMKAGGEDATTGFIAVSQGISSIIGMVSPLADALGELGTATGNTEMQNFANDMKLAVEWGQTLTNLTTALATGNPTAIVGSLVEITTKLIKAEAEYQTAKRKFLLENIKMQYEYNNLLMAEQLQFASGTSIFGTDAYGKAVNSIGVYRDAIAQTTIEIEKLGDAEIVTGVKRKKSGLWGALLSPAAAIATLVTGGGATVGTKNTYGNLLEVEKDLINTDGTLNANRVKALLATDKLTESTRQLLEQLVELDQKAKDAYAQMTEYLTNVFGSIGQSLSDSIVSAFKDGTDASLAFKTSVEGTVEKLTQDLMQSLFLQDYFTKFSDQIKKIYETPDVSENKIGEQTIALMAEFYSGLGGIMSQSEDFLANMQAAAAKYGLDLFKPTTTAKTGLAGEIKGVTEDTSRMLASILNGVYGLVGTQGITLKSIEGVLINTGNVTANSLAQLVLIQSNTYQTAQLLKSVIGGKGSQGDGIRVWM